MERTTEQKLKDAQLKAEHLFHLANERRYFVPGQTEKELNGKIYNLAFELYGIKKYWHKRIVRSGPNTLHPYDENPENLVIKNDDIFFLDFGPVFEDWEADLGRTFVLGTDPVKLKIKDDVRKGFDIGVQYFLENPEITGSELYSFSRHVSEQMGWEFGGTIAGHIIGNFPHKDIIGSENRHYVHPDNHEKMNTPDQFGKKRHWIYEIHYVDRNKGFGGFFEQLLTIQ